MGKTDDGVLIIRRIHVHYLLVADEEHRETVARVHDMHAMKCPVYRTLKESIEITTDFELGSG